MTYAIKQDMIDRYGEEPLVELTDRTAAPTGAIDDVILARALSDADAQINSYVGARYALPLSPTPDIIVRHACVIAYYVLHRGRYTDETRREYDDVLKFLTAVSKGDAVLDAAGTTPPSAAADASVIGPERIFSRESLKGY